MTMDDAPTWLVYDTSDGGVAWRRIPDALEPLDLVDARFNADGHADPSEALLWLQGKAAEPWGEGFGSGDGAVVRALVRTIRRSCSRLQG
jgi:hypothetical protein